MRSADWMRVALGCLIACTQGCDEPPPPLPPAPFRLRVDAGSVVTESVAQADGCPATTERSRWLRGTLHGATVSGYERWTRAGSPHRVPHGAHLIAGATLDVEGCAVVLVGAGADLVVQGDARLRAEGTRDTPILFASLAEEPTSGDWVGLEVRAAALPGTALSHVRIEHAGAEPARRGDPPAAIRSWQRSGLRVIELDVRDTAGWGVALMASGGFHSASRALRVSRASEGAVMFFDVDDVGTLPEGDLRGNARDEVLIAGERRELQRDATWRNPGVGVRYRVRRSARVLVQGANAPTLTIAPGATLAFDDDAELAIGWEAPGSLVAQGSASGGPVVFTSSHTPVAPATWVGLRFGPHAETSRSHVELARVEGAGAPTGASLEACAIRAHASDELTGMVLFQGVFAQSVIMRTRFVAGPPRGVAVLVAGDSPLRIGSFVTPESGNDVTSAGVACAQNEARVAGRCPATPRCLTEIGAPSHRVTSPSQSAQGQNAGARNKSI